MDRCVLLPLRAPSPQRGYDVSPLRGSRFSCTRAPFSCTRAPQWRWGMRARENLRHGGHVQRECLECMHTRTRTAPEHAHTHAHARRAYMHDRTNGVPGSREPSQVRSDTALREHNLARTSDYSTPQVLDAHIAHAITSVEDSPEVRQFEHRSCHDHCHATTTN